MKRIVLLMIVVLVLQMLPLSAIEASPNNTNIGLSWRAEYYANQYLIPPASLVRDEGALSYNWGTNPPLENGSIPADYFTVRWTTRPTLAAGTYRFKVTADDSVKLTVDNNNVVIDTMDNPKPGQSLSVDLNLNAGPHLFQVDFRELIGNAYITATLERIDGGDTPPDAGSPPLPSSASAYVTTYALRFRSGPGLNYTILGSQPRNTVVRLIGRNSDASWAKVTLPDGRQGWMSTSYLSANVDYASLPVVGGEITERPVEGQLIGTVTAYALNVRSGPSTNFTIIGRLVLFTPVGLIGRNEAGTWVRIRRSNGSLGWVSASYLRVAGSIYSLPVVY